MSAKLSEGTIFARRYRVVRCIASGGMGAVYEVVHLETDRRRAMKVMHPHVFQSQDMRERFKREARIAANIESEYIVDVSDAGVDESTGIPFLVMELLRGEELGARLKRVGRLPPAEALTYLHQTAMALDRTHAASIVHRDLKPENLFCTQRDDGSVRIKILDFGIAKLVADSAPGKIGVTRNLGTPLYMSPEQFDGTNLTGAADIYALGMMAYTLLVGEPYWVPETKLAGGMVAFVTAVTRGPQEPATERAAARGVVLPQDFNVWFAHATAGNPAARFRTATEAVRALALALGETTGPGIVVAARSSGLPRAELTAAGLTPAAVSAPAGRRPGDPGRGSSPHLLERAATSTGAAVSHVSAPRGRGPLVAMGVLLGLGVGVGAWLMLRPESRSPGDRDAATAAAVAPTNPAMASSPIAAASAEAAVVSAPATVEVSPLVTAAPPGSSAGPVPSASAVASASPKARWKPPPGRKPSGRSPSIAPLLGRD